MAVSAISITLVILFVAAFVKACTGFGEALLALPVLALAFQVRSRVSERLATESFERLVYGALIMLGVLLLA